MQKVKYGKASTQFSCAIRKGTSGAFPLLRSPYLQFSHASARLLAKAIAASQLPAEAYGRTPYRKPDHRLFTRKRDIDTDLTFCMAKLKIKKCQLTPKREPADFSIKEY